ncbi:MAG: LysR family transcriptional regulator [Saprospiraceae bacterium]|nr:LysR family transcriptional regulator [Lewinella sp.]
MELRQLQYFITLANELHFKRAAEKLFIVQPALSKQIKNLEEELGVQLFERNRRKVLLTPAGHYFRQETGKILQQLEQISNRVRLVKDGKGGEIRMGYVGSCIHTFLPQIISQLHERYPDIHLYLDEMTSHAQLRAIQRGALDVAFCRNPELTGRYGRQLVFRETFSLILPEDHVLQTEDFHSMQQLEDEIFILPKQSDGDNYYKLQLSICEDAGFTPVIAHETVHGHTALNLVDQRFGISILPTSFAGVTSANVRFIELTDIPQRSEITAVWDKRNPNPTLPKFLRIIEVIDQPSSGSTTISGNG